MKDTILTYLEKTGKINEFNLFFKHYHNKSPLKFALIKISEQTSEHYLDTFAHDMAFFNKVGLYPIIIHNGSCRLKKKYGSQPGPQQPGFFDAEDIKKIKYDYQAIEEQLKKAISRHGARARIIKNSIQADYCDQKNQGLAGKITAISLEQIELAIASKEIPIINPLAVCRENEKILLKIDTDLLANKMVRKTGCQKFIIINEEGGILDCQGSIISFINLSSDEDMNCISSQWFHQLAEIKEFIDQNIRTEVVITSSKEILKEIFTIKGSGTYIKNYLIRSAPTLDELNIEQMAGLLENSFQKKLQQDYFKQPFKEVFYQKDYEALAVIRQIGQENYLCKFAVSRLRSGTGMGKALWNTFIKKYPRLIWRSKPDNPINSFYISKCTGLIKKKDWYVFWRDIEDDKLLQLIPIVLTQTPSFIE